MGDTPGLEPLGPWPEVERPCTHPMPSRERPGTGTPHCGLAAHCTFGTDLLSASDRGRWRGSARRRRHDALGREARGARSRPLARQFRGWWQEKSTVFV